MEEAVIVWPEGNENLSGEGLSTSSEVQAAGARTVAGAA